MLIYRNSKNQNNTLKGEKERTITASFYTTSKMLWVFSCCHPSVDTMVSMKYLLYDFTIPSDILA
jgi:hypothetical protein